MPPCLSRAPPWLPWSSAPGALYGSTVQFPVTAATASLLDYLLIALLAVLIVIAVLLLRMLLTGSLFLATVDDRRGMVTLRGWPMISFSTSHLIDEPGRVVVRGLPSRRMRVRVRLTGKPPATVELARGGRTMAVGIGIVHRTRSSERQQAARGPRPDGW